MDMEDVLTELREEEGVWFDGFDWAERRRNDGREREKRERENGSGSDASSMSSGSRSSNGTSPVLSTTTLQTTPSPPPILGEEGEKKMAGEDVEESGDRTAVTKLTKPVTIAIGPILDPPKLLRAIPFVPITMSHMPQFSLEAFRAVRLPLFGVCFSTNPFIFRCGGKRVRHCIIVGVRSASVLWPRPMLRVVINSLSLLCLPKLPPRLHQTTGNSL
jgi:hypothetical protein